MYHSFLTIFIPALIAFISTIIGIKFVINYFSESGIVATDRNKPNKPTLPTSLGIPVVVGFGIGLMSYIFGASFNLYIPVTSLEYLFATILAVSIVSFVGFIDDINVKRAPVKTTGMVDTRKGLKQWQKPLLTLIGAIPLIAINAGTSTINLPFFGPVAFGIFYPLIIVPLALAFGANAFNLLEGFNGIASGSATMLAIAMFIYSIYFGTYFGALVSAILVAVFVAALLFNKYPAIMLPGDSFTYFAGAALITTMIIGNMESFGVIIFIPWIIEFILHAKKRFDVSDLGILEKDGTFKAPYGKKIYSFTHLGMNLFKGKEYQITTFIWAIDLLFIIIGFGMKFVHLL